ncbi:gtpase slip-gc, partial [Fusarium mundagurra]
MDDQRVDTYISQCEDLCRNQEVIQKLNQPANLIEEIFSLKAMYPVLKETQKTAESQRSKAQKAYDKAIRKYRKKLKSDSGIWALVEGLDGVKTKMRINSPSFQSRQESFGNSTKLSATAHESCTTIQRLNPLELKDDATQRFLDEALRIVQKWSLKYPDDEHNITRMHWCTYMANLNRNGPKSSSYATGVTYNWTKHCGVEPIMKSISGDLDENINKRLPTTISPMILGYTQVFTQYLNELNHLISDKVPSLAFSSTCSGFQRRHIALAIMKS